tara:strand:- start:369 stop:716 length:348 start_codon:yes stop_codon:yes gene_type:complete
MRYLANHQIIEFYDCNEDIIKNTNFVKGVFVKAAEMSQATIVAEKFHEFNPVGLTGVLVITESHISIHTWPEFNYVAVDVFSCDNKVDHNRIKNSLAVAFQSKKVKTKSIKRGKV